MDQSFLASYRFSDHLPKDCPPHEAEPVAGEVYRGIKKGRLRAEDFLSHREQGIRCSGDECLCCGLSVWVDLRAAKHAVSMIPYMRKWKIAKASLSPRHGVIKHTPEHQPDHYTYWPDKRNDCCQLFSIIDAVLPNV